LIVEDEEHVRELAESYLREQGHQTLSAATKDQALAVFEVVTIEVLFVDIGLYESREVGLDLAKQLSSATQSSRYSISRDRLLQTE
jgi:DNA-binding response OmpR family regulator